MGELAESTVGERAHSARAHESAYAKMDMFVVKMLQDGLSRKAALRATWGDGRKLHEAMTQFPELRRIYDTAMTLRADMAADEVLEIADSDDDPQKVKNRMQARQWYAAVISPGTYGARVDVNVAGTVSINDALAEGLARALRPMSDQGSIIDAQVIEQSTISDAGPADTQSDSAPARPAVPDIFS